MTNCANTTQMIYTPTHHIPIGEATQRPDGTPILRIKNSRTKVIDEITLDCLCAAVVRGASKNNNAEIR